MYTFQEERSSSVAMRVLNFIKKSTLYFKYISLYFKYIHPMPGIIVRIRTQLGTWKLKDVMQRDTIDDIRGR